MSFTEQQTALGHHKDAGYMSSPLKGQPRVMKEKEWSDLYYSSNPLVGALAGGTALTESDAARMNNIDTEVAEMMRVLAPEEGYNYGDLMPIKRSTDPQVREEDAFGGYRPAVPNVAREIIESLVRLKKESDQGYFNPDNALDVLL